MKQRLLETVGRSARLRLLNTLKRSSHGLPVKKLAGQMKMSYMGVKDLCLDLQKRGLLTTWRHAQNVGRPLMLYRLTEKAHELFPRTSNAFTLELLELTGKLHGSAAPEKLLMLLFHARGERYAQAIQGTTLLERAKQLAKLRDTEGYMSEVEEQGNGTLLIVEHHSPLLDVLDAYPLVAKLETDLFQNALGTSVSRQEEKVGGLFTATFQLGTNKAFNASTVE